MRRLFILLMVLAGVTWGHGAWCAEEFPETDPFRATVFGALPEQRLRLPGKLERDYRSFRIEDRRIPKVFPHNREMFYSLTLRKGRAPLIFLIPGTAADYRADKSRYLQELFYQAGCHVIALSSPSHQNFLVSVSEHGVAGYVPYDAADLYRVMGWIKDELPKDLEVASWNVVGYSMGGLHAVHVGKLDAEQKVFGFRRVVAVNPAVRLLASALRFDSWVTQEAMGGHSARQVLQAYLNRFADFYKGQARIDLTEDVLYRDLRELDLGTNDLRILMGLVFRLAGASMFFTSDICQSAGYYVANPHKLDHTDDLQPYFAAATQTSFGEYVREFLLPYLQRQNPAMTLERLDLDNSLIPLGEWVATSPSVRLVGTADDPILDQADVAFLRQAFGPRGELFAHGGHCGTFDYPPFAWALLRAVDAPRKEFP